MIIMVKYFYVKVVKMELLGMLTLLLDYNKFV